MRDVGLEFRKIMGWADDQVIKCAHGEGVNLVKTPHDNLRPERGVGVEAMKEFRQRLFCIKCLQSSGCGEVCNHGSDEGCDSED